MKVKKSGRTRLDRAGMEREFLAYAETKGWDEDRRLQVLAELSHGEPWCDLLDQLAQAGWTDELIEQLHQYYDGEEDYFSRLLGKVLQAKPTVRVNADLIDKVMSRLAEIKAS